MITFNLIQPNDDREKRGENAGKVLLNAENLRKSYGKGEARVDALADVSLQIYEGDRSLITLTPDHASLILIILHYNGSVDDLFNMIRNKTLNKNINNENLAQVFNLQPITENKIKGDIEISVKEHIRKLPKGCHASPTKIKEAFSKGIDISDGSSTLVRSYTRNVA